jgi:glycine cleavage system transcriptional repressor
VAQIAVSALGRDRPGIVAAVSGVLLGHGLNLADSQMGIISGRFTMTLIVEGADDLDREALLADLQAVADELGLDTVVAHDVPPAGDAAQAVPTHIITVYGVDHPGIVHAVTRELAAQAVNITDLNTRLVHDEGEAPLYVMMLEIVVPPGADERQVIEELRRVAREQGVDATVRELGDEAL